MADERQDGMSGSAGDMGVEPAGEPVSRAVNDAGEEASAAPASLRLPVIVPMRRALDDDAAVDEWPAPRPRDPHRAAAPRWMHWLRSRAAVVAMAAVTGGVVGAAAVAGIGQVLAERDDGPPAAEAVDALRASIGQLANEIKALKSGVGEGSRAAADGLSALEDRLAAAETAQAGLAGEIASLSRGLSRDTAAAVPQVSPEVTGSVTRSRLAVAQDWVLWRVRNGRALVQGNGGYFEVVPGSQLPGLGLVQRIVKQDGRWMVLTRNGVIVARG